MDVRGSVSPLHEGPLHEDGVFQLYGHHNPQPPCETMSERSLLQILEEQWGFVVLVLCTGVGWMNE